MSDFDEAKFEADEKFWEDPQGYINQQINKGVANASVQQTFQSRYPDVPLDYAGHLAGQHAEEIKGLSTDAAMAKIADIARETLGPAQQQQNSTGSILRRRKEARREARLGQVHRLATKT